MKKDRKSPTQLQKSLPTLAVGGLILFVFAEMAYLSLARYYGFNSK